MWSCAQGTIVDAALKMSNKKAILHFSICVFCNITIL